MKPSDASADDTLPFSPEEEATMQAEIDLLMKPYEKIAPAKLLPALRENLEHALRTHPYPRQLLRAFAEQKPALMSGERPIDGSEEIDEKAGGKDGA
jgi:hypothetical protein